MEELRKQTSNERTKKKGMN